MVETIEQQSGQHPEAILADSGYCSEENLEQLEPAGSAESKIEGFIATGKQKHGEHRQPAQRGPFPKGATRLDRMKQKLGKAVYAARKCVVEPVFGQVKQARGFLEFLLRGKEKVKREWALLCPTHNSYNSTRRCSTESGHQGMIFNQNRSFERSWGEIGRAFTMLAAPPEFRAAQCDHSQVLQFALLGQAPSRTGARYLPLAGASHARDHHPGAKTRWTECMSRTRCARFSEKQRQRPVVQRIRDRFAQSAFLRQPSRMHARS
jgi:hypothetical protein